MDEFIHLDVVLLPSDGVANLAIEASRNISGRHDVQFVLNKADVIPHVTIYSPEFPRSRVGEVVDRVADIARLCSAYSGVFTNCRDDAGWVVMDIDVPNLQELHENIVCGLNPLRDDHIRDKYSSENRDNYTDEQWRNTQEFGSSNVMGLYAPHLTLTRLKDTDDARLVCNELQWSLRECELNRMAVCAMGEHGTCVKILSEWVIK